MIFMPWKENTLENIRNDFIMEVEEKIYSFSAICRKYQITRKTGYKWYNRYKSGESLSDKSRRPFHTPNKIPNDLEEKITLMRKQYPYWGSRKIKKVMENQGFKNLPSATTFTNVFKRNNQISKEESEKREHYIRFEKEHPNEMWQMDFKGQFLLLDGNTYCYPLTIKDDNSRLGIATVAMRNQQTQGVKRELIKAFKKYGVPNSILSDNGKPWGDSKTRAYTGLDVWLMEHNILPIHCKMKHPQTQGKCENFNKILKNEVLKYENFHTLEEAQKRFDCWLYQYNNIRPHEALNMDTPIEHYKKSYKKYNEEIEEYKYSKEANIIKVSNNGYIRINKKPHFFSEGFKGKYVALISNIEDPNQQNIIFRDFIIAKFDITNNKIIEKFAKRIK